MEREMQFRENEAVITPNGEKVGEIDRVVIDPRSNAITHIVIRRGFLFTEDKVVPVEWVSTTDQDSVVLSASEDQVNTLPNFEETHYIRRTDTAYPVEHAQPYFWYPGVAVNWWSDPGYRSYFGSNVTPFAKIKTRTTPEDMVPLKEGAKVYSSDDRHVGNVAEVIADPESQRATHFVIESGLIFKERRLIPTPWIDLLTEDDVFLGVSTDFLDHLAPYKG